MTVYHLIQPELTDAQVAEVNSRTEWPSYYRAYCNVTSLLEKRDYDATLIKLKAAVAASLYRHVADAAAESPEDVFRELNGAGPARALVTPFKRHKSMSVGDVLVFGATRNVAVCCSFGFLHLRSADARWFAGAVPLNPNRMMP